MKQLTFFSLVLLLAACGNNDGPIETTTPSRKEGLGVAITQFAQWQRGNLVTVDGEYDAKEGQFIPCGKTEGVPVSPEAVKIISGGNCGDMPTKLEPYNLVVVRRSGKTFNVVSRNITLQESQGEKGKAQYESAGGLKKIEVDPETMHRIKTEPQLWQRVQPR